MLADPEVIRFAGTFVIGIGCGATFNSRFAAFVAMVVGAILWNAVLGV
jgi:hypothetical protein